MSVLSPRLCVSLDVGVTESVSLDVGVTASVSLDISIMASCLAWMSPLSRVCLAGCQRYFECVSLVVGVIEGVPRWLSAVRASVSPRFTCFCEFFPTG